MSFPALLASLPEPDGSEQREESPLHARLEAHARYLSLVAEQLRAMDAGDLGRLRELLAERVGLETEMDEETEPLLARALQALDREMERDQELRDHWRSLQEDALRVTRGVHAPRLHRGRYPLGPLAPARLDVRF